MRDYFKGTTSALTPDRDRLVRAVANWLCHVRDTGHCKKHGWTATAVTALGSDNVYIFVTKDKSDSKLFEAANQAVPRNYRNRRFAAVELETNRPALDIVT